jgi:hypothetical protein
MPSARKYGFEKRIVLGVYLGEIGFQNYFLTAVPKVAA